MADTDKIYNSIAAEKARAQYVKNLMGAADGIATLDSSGLIPSEQLPSYVDDIIDLLAITDTAPATCAKGDLYFNTTTKKVVRATGTNTWGTSAATNTDPEKSKIYVNLTNDKTYRWSGSAMVEISSSDVIGIKVGSSGSTLTPSQGVITIPEYETGADVTDAENVKAALGTDSTHGGAFLRKDGTWQTPPNDNTTYGLSVGTGDDANKIVLTPSSGNADKITVPYASNAGTVNGKTVEENVPSGAKFTDTTYESKSAASGGTDVSLVTTGEKYTWNNKQDALAFNQTPSSSNKVATMADIPTVSYPVTSVAGKTGAVTLAKGDVGLGNVDNTADSQKSVNYANSAGNADTVDSKHAIDFVQDAGSNITGKIYDVPCKTVFSGNASSVSDAPESSGWFSGLALGDNWNSNHYQRYIVNQGYRLFTTASYENGSMINWQTLAYLSDIPSSLPANGGNADTVDGYHLGFLELLPFIWVTDHLEYYWYRIGLPENDFDIYEIIVLNDSNYCTNSHYYLTINSYAESSFSYSLQNVGYSDTGDVSSSLYINNDSSYVYIYGAACWNSRLCVRCINGSDKLDRNNCGTNVSPSFTPTNSTTRNSISRRCQQSDGVVIQESTPAVWEARNAATATYATSAGSAPASDVYSWAKQSTKPSYSFGELTSHPTTLSDYGITDASIANGVITLGSNTITPLTSFTETDPTVPSWAKAANKPSYAYSEIGYTVNPVVNSSTSVSLAGTTPLHVVTTSVSITAVTLSANPAEGHSCHVIFANGGSSELTVSMTHDSTNRVCPGGTDPDPLTIPVGGYVEIDFLTANSKVYVRGVE